MFADTDGTGAELWAMAQLATPMAVRVAATLRIADHIAAGVRTAPELASAANADADALDRLLRYLATRGVFRRGESGEYHLTPLAEPLRDDHPTRVRGWLDIEGAGRAELSFVQLLHSVRTGEAAFPVQFGRSLWEDLATDPDRTDSFNASMSSSVPGRSPELIAGYDWGSLGHVVDVGGGDGSFLIDLLTRYPRLRGTVVDRPDTAETARKALAAAGLADRGEAVAGSFFDPLPPGAGGYLLSLVLHNWADEPARAILRRCAEAAGRDGSVFVVEQVRADGSPRSGMDLRMLAYCGGKERGTADLAALGAAAGLRLAAVHGAGTLSIFELAPA
ncbi:MAG TPA: methyltransferase [Streptosporangiaceae bacterium]